MRINLTYRQKLRLKKLLKWVGILLAAAALLLVLFFVFVERYVVYGKDGVRIDYSRSASQLEAAPSAPPSETVPKDVTVIYDTPIAPADEDTEIKGYLITTGDLENPDSLLMRLADLEKGTTILIQLKDYGGLFYYNTNLAGAKRADVDLDGIQSLINSLRQEGYTLAALIPAFPDDQYALAHAEFALAREDGSLWVGPHHAYWLNPDSDTVLTYLEQIAAELSGKGFSEIVFEDFYFPEDGEIVYEPAADEPTPDPEEQDPDGQQTEPGQDDSGDEASGADEPGSDEPGDDQSRPVPTPREMTAAAIERMVTRFADSGTIISFMTDSIQYPMMGSRNHLYIQGAEAAQIESFMSVYQWEGWDPAKHLVFITSSKDSRFDGLNTISPLH